MKKLIIPMVLVTAMLGQTGSGHKQPAAVKPSIDVVIDLVQGGMSESLVIKTLQSQDKVYSLSTNDVLRLQKAGVTENIIAVMMDPKASVATPAVPAPNPAPPSPATASENAVAKNPSGSDGPTPVTDPAADTTTATPYPPDLPNVPTNRKRRVVVAAFGNGAVRGGLTQDGTPAITPFQAYMLALYGQQLGAQNVDDVGRGIRALLMTRLQQSNILTVLERNEAVEKEQKLGLSDQIQRGTQPGTGHNLGADCIVTGDITIFGRDNQSKTKGGIGGAIPGWEGAVLGRLKKTDKEEKAVVAIAFNVVDSETSQILVSANARGESIRKSKNWDLGGLGIGSRGAAGGGFENAITSSGFEKTILGEATMDAVNKFAKQLEEQIPQLPPKKRKIEGRLANIKTNGAYLALGGDNGVEVGDRFEIRKINNIILDPQTKDEIGIEADKVGELVVTEVEEKMAIGNYGGQPLSEAQRAGKGYQVRLMSK